tara:strand:+ start:134 stop:454 length:321 start_codon:yes stop_codon:yes gene_type:complete
MVYSTIPAPTTSTAAASADSARFAPRVAVCLTGLQRSFPEIGHNVMEGIYHMAGPGADIDFFGVKPPEDDWGAIRQLLPMRAIGTQARYAALTRNATPLPSDKSHI